MNCSRGNIIGIAEVQLIYGEPEPAPEPEPASGQLEMQLEPEPEADGSGSWDFSSSGFLSDDWQEDLQALQPDSEPIRVPELELQLEPEPEPGGFSHFRS